MVLLVFGVGLVVVVLPIVFELLADLMGYFDHKFSVQVEFLCQLKSKILGGVIRVVDVPLEPVLEADIVDLDIQLQYLQAFFRLGPMHSMMAYRFFYGFVDLVFKGSKKGVLSDEGFDELLRSEVRLIHVPAKHFLVLLAVDLQFQVDGNQILF